MKKKAVPIGKNAKTNNAGFTLLETAIASMIMLVGIMAVMNLFVLAKISNQSSKQSVLATSLAKRKVEELLALPLADSRLTYSAAATTTDPLNEIVTGYYEYFYVNSDRGTTKGNWQVATTPFYTGQAASYVVTWRIDPDNVLDASNNPVLPGLRRIQVRARAIVSAMQSNGVAGDKQTEIAEISTIRTPASN